MTYDELSNADLYEQLAEEATELAQACLKMSRKLRGTNPTPLSIDEITKMLTEEFTDVVSVASILLVGVDSNLANAKRARWNDRLSNLNPDKASM